MTSSLHERELDILEAIHNRRHIKQRDLAHILGISVGMTNAIIRRLAQKGLLTVKKVNNRNIRYAVSPEGTEALARRSFRYLKNTIRNVVDSKQAVEDLAIAVKRLGFTQVLLVGPSALDFVVEHVCTKYNLEYRQVKELHILNIDESTPAAYLLYGENYREPDTHHRDRYGYLSTILSDNYAELVRQNQGVQL